MRLPPAGLCFLAVALLLSGCRTYTQSTPRDYFEGDHAANYSRIFGGAVPSEVTVLNSVVVGYAWRPGVVTTDDFEFELLAPPATVQAWIKRWGLRTHFSDDPGIARRMQHPIRPWYAPGARGDYEAHRDLSSVGYLHLLIAKTPEPDGRQRVFVSKH